MKSKLLTVRNFYIVLADPKGRDYSGFIAEHGGQIVFLSEVIIVRNEESYCNGD